MLDLVSTEVIDALPPGLLDALGAVHQDSTAEVLADIESWLAGIDSSQPDLLYAAHTRALAAWRSVGHRDSVRHGLELVSLAERMDRNEFRCHAHSELAEAYRLLGVLERAVTHLREALRFASMNEADQTAMPFLRLGLTYLALERPADALACLERARNSFLHLGLVSNAAEALVGEARALLSFGQTGEALHRLERAEAGLRLAEADDDMPLVYRLMGEATAAQGAAAKAAAHFRLALRLHEQGHGRRFEADTYLAFASFQLDRGDPYTARTTLEHALELFRNRGDSRGQAQAIRMLGQVFESAGDFASALASLKEHLQLRSDIEQESSEQEASLRVMQLERSITREYASARKSQQALVDANRVLREQASRLEQLSKTDYLTGLYNRRYLTEHLEAE